ncbi:MAG TPA: PQQ-binding-like beta-propeller repeat protein [Phycisphaerales bacterium]|nr:PQQ-binding-like beta-propeller repeat protein [Phycisphaerales bacterium]
MRLVLTLAIVSAAAGHAVGQTITQVLPGAAERSARVVVVGSEFGASQSGSSVTVDGIPAVVTWWSDSRIHAHVPHEAELGPAEVRVVRDQSSEPAELSVLPRAGADGRILWRLQVDHLYSLSRPAVASDGTIYATGVGGPLYAVTPSGEVKWVVQNAGGARPATVSSDGTVYTSGAGGAISAISAEGGVLWSYRAPSNAGGVFVGPNVGPDGKIYAVTQEEPSLGTDFGAFALHPDGTLAWSRSGGYNQRRIAYGWEVVFGGGLAYFITGQGNPINGNHGVHALDLGSGQESWMLPGTGRLQRDGAGNLYWLGAINNNFIGSYAGDGEQRWAVSYNDFVGQPGGYVVAPSGASYYCTSTFTTLAALAPDGSTRWQHRDFNHLFDLHAVTPDGERFFGIAFPTDNTAPEMRLWSGDDGSVLWRQDVPREDDAWMAPQWEGQLSPDGRVLYITLSGNNYVQDPYSYLYAIDVSEAGPCAADIDGNGSVNTLDVLAFLNAWSSGDEAADFNADGAVNTLDVLAYLNAWSARC